MIAEEKIQEILNDLFSLEPDLKPREAEIRRIIIELQELKPDIQFDPDFAYSLKQELAKRAGANLQTKPTFFKQFINAFNPMNKVNYPVLFGASALVVVVLVGGIYYRKQPGQSNTENGNNSNILTDADNGTPIAEAPIGSEQQVKAVSQVKKFESEEEFKTYLSMAGTSGYGGGFAGGLERSATQNFAPMAQDSAGSNKLMAPVPTGVGYSERSSQTNVQVLGIDEPDIVKTDGQNLYVSTEQNYYYGYGIKENVPSPVPTEVPMDAKMAPTNIMPPYRQPEASTQIISALPPETIKKLGKIDKQGEMLLYKDILVIFYYDYIYGFSIKDASNPKEVWKIKYENNSQLSAARLKDGKLYLVTASYPNFDSPCPIMPMSINGTKISMPCREIYHPIVPVSDVTTYSVLKINPESGQVDNKLSFVGSTGQAVVYVSDNAIYLTYTYMEDQVKIMADFLKTSGRGIFPESVMTRIDKVNSYDLSPSTKMVELQQILEKYMASLGNDGRVKLQNDMQNKISDYLKEHKRGLQFTGIAKIALDKFEVTATGNVPGSPLNQFALDEFQGNLRIATTIGENGFWYWGGGSRDESANDVYVLDGSLNVTGKVLDLGKGERIYSARFIDDKGYLVTFRQTDPFYVLDLSNPKNPQVKGELKIPGYSSYLHPLATNRILGVGQESGRVKLSLFDVSDPSNPKEINKYQLDEYWTEASNNHHAFLQDSKHQVFFLPGGNSGYIFSYAGDKLELKKAVSEIQAKRAVYINDAMYIVGNDKIVVVDEKNWERVGELGF